MSKTRTGGYAIGIRRLNSDWQTDIWDVVQWAKVNDFDAVDLRNGGDNDVHTVAGAGLRVGSIDLADWQGMICSDNGRRAEAIERNRDHTRNCADIGSVNHFVVMLPEDPGLPRHDNFRYMIDSYGELATVLMKSGACVVIEGWPGPGALCSTPEGYRSLFRECPSATIGINYDPSHLLRMGIDPLRFLDEFGDRMFHTHGKDTELLPEGTYEYGNYQDPTFGKPVAYGGMHWRYTIPGHGQMRWVEAFRMLESHNYNGCVSIELEDCNFNGAADTEKDGFIRARQYLEGC